MPVNVRFPYESIVDVYPLSQHEFFEFGTVIENPEPVPLPFTEIQQLPSNAIRTNQGTALKYQDVTNILDLYGSAPSKVASRAVMNMFVCAPRALRPSSNESFQGIFPVEILERHPFTTQTFIPLGLSPTEQQLARYLVIVAPSLSPSCEDGSLPVSSQTLLAGRLPGQGLPDLTKLRAFIAKGSQAVTYGAGTWHAPMVVVGAKPVEFVVVQFANGVGIEDCQEAAIQFQGQGGLQVVIPKVEME